MKRLFQTSLLLIFLAGVVSAQDGQKEIVIVQKESPRNFTTFRVGLWFPKDGEKTLKFTDATTEAAQSKASQAQAFGLDIHIRDNIGNPIFLDFSAGAWYSSDLFEYSAQEYLASNIFQQKLTTWALIVPVTAGLSIAPLPEKNPLQPYVMAGVGAYFATGGTKAWYPTASVHSEKTKIVFGSFIGAGLDFLLSPALGASLGLKYHFVKFKEPLSTFQQDFTGLQIQLGIASTF